MRRRRRAARDRWSPQPRTRRRAPRVLQAPTTARVPTVVRAACSPTSRKGRRATFFNRTAHAATNVSSTTRVARVVRASRGAASRWSTTPLSSVRPVSPSTASAAASMIAQQALHAGISTRRRGKGTASRIAPVTLPAPRAKTQTPSATSPEMHRLVCGASSHVTRVAATAPRDKPVARGMATPSAACPTRQVEAVRPATLARFRSSVIQV